MNILEKIVADKAIEIEQRQLTFPLEEFKQELTESDRDFKQALKQDRQNKGAAFILECKKASPSKGLIRAEFNLDEICQAYGKYASCVSVLTDEKYFDGEFERLPKVRNRLSQPVLCKDFFIDVYQVYLARYYGANAILLMLSVLDDKSYLELKEVATSLKLDVLTEVSNLEEMARAVNLNADIIGINNRNLRDLSTNLEQTPNLVQEFKALASSAQQANTLLISESGIYHHDQVKHLSKHVDGFLIGSSLMAQDDLDRACTGIVFGEHKVCGITQACDAKAAFNAGAHYCGLIFVESSPRVVSLEQAAEIVDASASQGQFVAVVKDAPISTIMEIVQRIQPFAIQLHGSEDQAFIDSLNQALAEIPNQPQIWKAIAIDVSGELPRHFPKVDRLLLDTKTPNGQSGGTGVVFDWQQLTKLPLNLPPVMLAGGLSLDNVEEARALPVAGLDFNSGVELKPGIKDTKRIEAVFAAIYQDNSRSAR